MDERKYFPFTTLPKRFLSGRLSPASRPSSHLSHGPVAITLSRPSSVHPWTALASLRGKTVSDQGHLCQGDC